MGGGEWGGGYALTEELTLAQGVPESCKLRSLGLIRAKDMPEVLVVLVESCDPEGPFGAKGVGEIGLVLINWGKAPFVIRRGDRIAQMVVTRVSRAEVLAVNRLETTARGEGGFGHSGVK